MEKIKNPDEIVGKYKSKSKRNWSASSGLRKLRKGCV
jgi:hypothetical protein